MTTSTKSEDVKRLDIDLAGVEYALEDQDLTIKAGIVRTSRDTIRALRKERDALREALDPNLTKAAYLGEIKERITVTGYDEDGELDERTIDHTVSWDTIKAMMAMIAARAALGTHQ